MRTVRYGEHADQVIDLWEPPGSEQRPAAVLVHGGYWRQTYDRSYLVPFAEHLAAQGIPVASVEYRRVRGAGGWPGTFDDVAQAVDALPELLGGRPLVLVGHSAGGHLALWASGRHRLPPTSRWHRDSRPQVAKVLALAPLCDLARAHELGLSDNAVTELLGARVAERLPETDPMALLPLDVPVVVLHGDADVHVPVELAKRFAEAAGESVRLVVPPGVDHFQFTDPADPVSELVVRELT